MKIIAAIFLGLLLTSLSLLSSCYYDVEEVLYAGSSACDTVDIGYLSTIKPIIETQCATSGCHVPGTGRKDLTTDQGIMDIVNDGRLEDRVVKNRDMPPLRSLSTCEIKYINQWLGEGAPAN